MIHCGLQLDLKLVPTASMSGLTLLLIIEGNKQLPHIKMNFKDFLSMQWLRNQRVGCLINIT